ncbi:MAG: hypothetical protein IPJ08_07645 [Burkholderiales bacterium]|nr:hypothetical protein [Burkholderiales bacterium]
MKFNRAEIVLSIVTPPDQDPRIITSKSKAVCIAIRDEWRANSRSKTAAIIGTESSEYGMVPCSSMPNGDDASTPSASLPNHAVAAPQCSENHEESESSAALISPMIRHFLEALDARPSNKPLKFSFEAAGEQDQHPPVIVPPPPQRPAASFTLGDPHTIEGEVGFRTGPATCLAREVGVTKQKRASFSTSSSLGTFLNMLMGCRGVLFEVRDYVSDQSQVTPPHDFYIERIVGRSDAFAYDTSVLDYLQQCLDDLRSILAPTEP